MIYSFFFFFFFWICLTADLQFKIVMSQKVHQQHKSPEHRDTGDKASSEGTEARGGCMRVWVALPVGRSKENTCLQSL